MYLAREKLWDAREGRSLASSLDEGVEKELLQVRVERGGMRAPHPSRGG
jgi:hypothetical protein